MNETVEFERALRRELDMAIDQVVVNALHPCAFKTAEVQLSNAAAGETGVAGAAIGAAVSSTAAPAASTPSCVDPAARRQRAGGHASARVRARARPRRPRAAVRGAGAQAVIADWLERKEVCICAGSGGVGKTTTSAAIALGMAARGKKVAVLTIDPQAARELARACPSSATRRGS